MFAHLHDTIVAISSPPGAGVRGIIRLSGPDSLALAAGVFCADSPQMLTQSPGQRRLAGRVCVNGVGDVPAEAYLFRGPRSYTRQDVVELHLPGAPALLSLVLDDLVARGARPAEPGEFTARAYFSGALDLTEVEGVAAIVQARTDAQLRASEALLHGHLSRRTAALRDEIVDLLALIEAQIDFADEPIDLISSDAIEVTLRSTGNALARLLAGAASVEHLQAAPQVALAGRANAGKSTLFNRLCGMDRAIRSAIAGTTRDVLQIPVAVPGGEILLLDTAGLDEANAGNPGGPASLAQAAARRCIATADLLLVVIDASDAHDVDALLGFLPLRPRLLVASKIDLIPHHERDARIATLGGTDRRIAVSAFTGEGVSDLLREIGRLVFAEGATAGADLIALSSRQQQSLADAKAAISRARELCQTGENRPEFELLAIELREAMHALSLLLGEVSTEDLLGRIFSRFCIGK